jgi:microcystin-dependent protein
MANPFLSEVRIMAFGFAPRGWAMCNGQILPINQNQALFALLGTTYGGNGTTTFALPNLQGAVPVHMGSGGGTSVILGQVLGESAHTLIIPEMPSHNHALMADAVTAAASNTNTPAPAGTKVLGQSAGVGGTPPTPFGVSIYSTGAPNGTLNPSLAFNGGNQAHENEQPYLVLNFCIALLGIFPSRN